MAEIIKWPVIMVCPGEDDLPLLAALTSRSDAQVIAVADPDGSSLGAGLAEVMGILVIRDLDPGPIQDARYLVYPELNDRTVPFVDLAPELGLQPLKTREFRALLEDPTHRGGGSTDHILPALDPEGLELESAAIHRTLSRIEEALDREGLLRWILGLAVRAVGADSGSIMLLDEVADELYVAFAEGLSQQTMLRTRVRMGEGIAGRVALKRKPELITDNQHPGARRDRSGEGAAVCAPLIWDGRLLGVLNLSAEGAGARLRPEALQIVQSLSHRFGLILDRFLRIQKVRDGELFRVMEEGLLREKRDPEALATTLSSWASDLQEISGADAALLSVLTADGDLFCASPDGSSYESPPDPVKAEVLASGKARVLRPGDLVERDPADNLTETMIFHLPVGAEPLRALFTVEFASPPRAHQFRSISGDIAALVSRHLDDYLDRALNADQIDRLTTLATALGDLVLTAGGPPSRQTVLDAARRLTGAGEALLLEGPPDVSGLPDGTIATAAAGLLAEAGQRGWRSTIVAGAPGSGRGRALLAVPLEACTPYPGLVLWDKERLHPLDAASFTEMDVLFVRRLLPLLLLERRAVTVAPVQPGAAQPAADSAPSGRDLLLEELKREMDRCDRYHTCLGLTAYRLPPDAGTSGPELVRGLAQHLRSSDRIFLLEDRTLVVMNPEDVQALPRLQARVSAVLRAVAGSEDLEVDTAARTFPGSADSPAALLDSLLNALS